MTTPDTTDEAAAWDPEVAALVGPGLAETERELSRILSPAERIMFLRGYTCRMQQEVREAKVRLDPDPQRRVPGLQE